MALMFYRNAQGPSSRTQELIDFCMLRTMHHDDDEEEETYDERKKNSTIFTKSPKEKAAILALERNVEQERESIRRQRIEDEKRLKRQLKEKRSMRLDDEERLKIGSGLHAKGLFFFRAEHKQSQALLQAGRHTHVGISTSWSTSQHGMSTY